MTTARSALAVAVCALVLGPAEAGAHGEASPLVRSVVDAVEPRIAGVSFTPVRGPAAQVLIRNRSREDVEVLDGDGRPFLRVGPRGTYGNTASPAYFASGNPDGQGVPAGLERTATPRWRLVSRAPSWAYYEHRLHPGQARLPAEARGARRTIRLGSFTVPLRHGGRPARIRGHLEFRPIRGVVTPELRSEPQPLRDVNVQMLPGPAPAVLLQNAGREPVTVLGRDGEPYARVGPRGAEVNLRSPVHVEDLRLKGELPDVPADPRAEPRWRRVNAVPSLTWTEPRARYPLEQPPDAVVESERRLRLRSWSIPLRAGDASAEVRGTTDWVPTEATGLPRKAAVESDAGDVPVLALAGAALLLAALVAGALRLRMRAR